MPGQIVWKDARGNTKLSEVVTRDVSENGVAVECLNGAAIPLYRLVYFQVTLGRAATAASCPPQLRKPNVLSAIFRVGPATTSDRRRRPNTRSACSSNRRASRRASRRVAVREQRNQNRMTRALTSVSAQQTVEPVLTAKDGHDASDAHRSMGRRRDGPRD